MPAGTDSVGAGQTAVFAGGGTGGHLFPGLAVADALRARDPEAQITFLTTDRDLDRRLLHAAGWRQVVQPVRPFTTHPLRVPAFWLAWRRSVRLATETLARLRPRAVLGLGGYAAGPAVVAARRLGIRSAILNPDASPGRANRFLARRCDGVFVQWEESCARLPDGAVCEIVGCPIRPAFGRTDAHAGRRHFGLDPDRPTLLVTGASQGAQTINAALQRLWPAFARAHRDWQLLHLTGPADEAEVRAAYGAAEQSATVLAFTDDMHLAMAAADVVISRAGASTLAELTAVGRAAILLPYPFHRDMHQRANAEVLVRRGAAICLEDRRDAAANAAQLGAALEALCDGGRRAAMARAARELGRPDAAARVAEWLAAD